MIVVPASLRSDFIHMAGMTIHIALESTIHIVGIRILPKDAILCQFFPGQSHPGNAALGELETRNSLFTSSHLLSRNLMPRELSSSER